MRFWIVLGLMVLWAALWARTEQKTQPRKDDHAVPLLQTVSVEHEAVRLSDLLPPDAPPRLRSASAAINLGPAPQPGSLRVFEKEELIQRLTEHPELIGAISLPDRVQVQRASWPIQQDALKHSIAEFLRARGMNSPKQPEALPLSWPAHVSALAKDPALEVTGTKWDPRRQALEFRLRCRERSLCGSFLVEMRLPRPPVAPQPLVPAPALATSQPGMRRTAILSASSPGPPLEKPGDAAILVLESGGIRISLPVICLQKGALRQKIRVRSAGGQRVFHAEVMGGGLLRVLF